MGNSQGKEATQVDTTTSTHNDFKESPYVAQILEARQKLTGWERVKLIFERDEYDAISPELQRLIHTMMISVVVGGLIGALGRGRIAHANFIKNHAHEVFETPLEAKRKLQDSVTIGMGSGAFRIGWRITLFTTIYMSVSTLVSTYRGKMGILDQVLGAGTAGFIYKFPQGPKAQVAGTVIGGLLGLSAGIMTLGITKLTGESIDTANLRYYHYLSKKQENSFASSKSDKEILRTIDRPIVDVGMGEHDDLTRFHDELIAALKVDAVTGTGNVDTIQQEQASSESSNETSSNTLQVNESKEISDVVQNSKSSSSETQIASMAGGKT